MTPAVVIPPTVADFLVACQAADLEHVASTYRVVCARCAGVHGLARVLRREGGGTVTVLPEGFRPQLGGVVCLSCAQRGVRR